MAANFELAVRKKYRFPYKGTCSVEDLWDLSLTELDGIYKVLNAQSKASKEDSLLRTRDVANTTLENQIEIIKHIVETKQAENDKAKNREVKKAEKAKLLAILANKQEADLHGKSTEELQAMIDALDEE